MDQPIKKNKENPIKEQNGDEKQDAGQQEQKEKSTEVVTEGPTVHAGGIVHPEGYEHVATIPNDDGSVRINVENLQENVEVDEVHGASVKLDRAVNDSAFGFLHGRIIHDFHAFLHIFRRDDPAEKKTHFKIHLGHGSGSNI